MSGLQLRWAPLLQTAFFATITLAAVSEDIPSFAGQHKCLAGAASRRLWPNNRRPPYPSLILRFNARAALSSRVFGFPAEGQTKTIISLASNHTCLRVPSATRPKVVSPTSGLCAPLKYKISVPIVTIIVNNTATWSKMFLNCPHSPLQKI